MKKIYFCMVGLLASGFVMGQKLNDTPVAAKNSEGFIQKAKPGNTFNSKATVLWSDDMSDSSRWMVTNAPTGTPAHTCCDWAWSDDINASPRPEFVPFGHTTVANGYMMINSDAAGGSATQNATTYCVDTMDLTGEPAINMLFEQATRKYAEQYFVVYSTDAGATWNEVEVNTTWGTNTNSTNPETVQVNLSAEIGGQDSVMIGFKYVGQWDWFWAVDDVQISTPDNYDLSLDGAVWGSTGYWGGRIPYLQIPTSQVTDINFSGVVSNIGAMDQANVVFHAHTTSGYMGMSAGDSLASTAMDTLDCTAPFTPAAVVGSDVIDLFVTSDSTDANPSNDSLIGAATIGITDYIYARDLGTAVSGSYNSGAAFEIGNVFDVFQTADAGGIDIYIHPQSTEGAEIGCRLYVYDATAQEFTWVNESDPYYIQAGDLDGFITLNFSQNGYNSTVNAGESYFVTAWATDGDTTTNGLIVGTAGTSPEQTSFVTYDGDWLSGVTQYYTTSTPMVRLNFEANDASINEVENNFGLTVYPNPSSNETNVSFVADNEEVSIVITDMAGKEVYSSVSEASVGNRNVAINTSVFNSGVYVIKLSSNNSVAIKNLIVK